jgi:hypothetical protein
MLCRRSTVAWVKFRPFTSAARAQIAMTPSSQLSRGGMMQPAFLQAHLTFRHASTVVRRSGQYSANGSLHLAPHRVPRLAPRQLACMATKASKSRTEFLCSSCGNTALQYFGRCTVCKEFDTCAPAQHYTAHHMLPQGATSQGHKIPCARRRATRSLVPAAAHLG